jgi:hypothetical protein
MNSIQPVAPSSHLVPASPVPRLAATALDGPTYLIIPAVLLPLGLLLARNGIVPSPLAVNGVGLVLVILPASLWATWWEAASKGATPGNGYYGLESSTSGPGRCPRRGKAPFVT